MICFHTVKWIKYWYLAKIIPFNIIYSFAQLNDSNIAMYL